ncbi:MAG: hypothetical protein AB1921_19960 [Thermodesulfobacteriota bacterium]
MRTLRWARHRGAFDLAAEAAGVAAEFFILLHLTRESRRRVPGRSRSAWRSSGPVRILPFPERAPVFFPGVLAAEAVRVQEPAYAEA